MASLEAIATTYMEADAASVAFTSIPSTYESLQLRISAREGVTTDSYQRAALGIQFNSDTGTNYTYHRMQSNISAGTATGDYNQSAVWLYWYVADHDNTGTYAGSVIDIMNYKHTSKFTILKYTVMAQRGGGGATVSNFLVYESGLWENTDAVTTLTIVPGFSSSIIRGSEFSLYGLKSS